MLSGLFADPAQDEALCQSFLGSESLVAGWEGIRKPFKPQTTYLREMAN